MLRRFTIGAMVSVMFLVGCDSGNSSTGTTPATDGTLSGSYKSADAIQGEYQTFSFAAGNQFIYKVEQGTCLIELDTGTAQLQTIQGTQVLQMTLTKGSGYDWNYEGTGCAPIVKYTADQMAVLGGPYPFRWVVSGTSYEIQVSETSWMRFNKI